MNWEEEKYKHYHLIRTDPMYRLSEQMADMEVQMQPAWSSFEPLEPEEPQVITKQTIILDKKALGLQTRIVSLEANTHTHTDKKVKDIYTIK